jgi:hypothetical protein
MAFDAEAGKAIKVWQFGLDFPAHAFSVVVVRLSKLAAYLDLPMPYRLRVPRR